MQLTTKSQEVFDYIKANGHVSVPTIAAALGRTEKSVNANLVDLQKKGLAVRTKEEVEGAEKPVAFMDITPDADAILSAPDAE